MEEHIGDVLAENATVFHNYLAKDRTTILQRLAWCTTTKSASWTGTPLDALVDKHMELLEKRFGSESLVLNIDSPETVSLICGKRLEKVSTEVRKGRASSFAELYNLGRIYSQSCSSFYDIMLP